MTQRLYLDHNATTPLRPEVFEAMRPLLRDAPAANASSLHGPGQAARYEVERAREEVAALLGCEPAEIVFTSGGTEADNLALLGAVEAKAGRSAAWEGLHIVSSGIEHPAVEECLVRLEWAGARVTRVPPDPTGAVQASTVLRALEPSTVLVSIMLANNETGAMQPLEEIAREARARGILIHTDAVQVAGRLPLNVPLLGVDMLSVSAHKMGGPQGVGALVCRRGVELSPRALGGPQERRRRGGTEPVALIAGFGEAARLARLEMGLWTEVTAPLRDSLEATMAARFAFARVHAPPQRLPNTSSISLPGWEAEAVVMALDLAGIAVSTGSACSSGAAVPSRVLRAMGLPGTEVASTIRVSFGPGNTPADVERLVEALSAIVSRAGGRNQRGLGLRSGG